VTVPATGVPLGVKPRFAFLIGVPASGKTTSQNSIPGVSTFVRVDPEAIEAMLRAADGVWDGTVHYHREGSRLAKALLVEAAADNRNILLECVGDDAAKMLIRTRQLLGAGYQVEVYGTSLDPQEATLRALSRWSRGGPWVLPTYILRHVGRRPEMTYWTLKRSGLVSLDRLFDTSAPKVEGNPPRPMALASERFPTQVHYRRDREGTPSEYLAEVEKHERDIDDAINAILRAKGRTDQEINELGSSTPEDAETIRLGKEDYWRSAVPNQ
jgi:hypothetical protein